MSNSLKALDKKISKRKQVYKPILDNPFTNESRLWPLVNDHQVVWQSLQTTIVSQFKNLEGTPLDAWPWDLLFTFNDIVKHLSDDNGTSPKDPVLLFVCNKDSGVPSVMLQQIPLLCFMSKVDVTLVQLPKNSYNVLADALPTEDVFDGLLLIRCNDKLNDKFVSQIKAKVEPLKFPWLNDVKYQKTNVKLVKTSMPITHKLKK